IGFAPDTRAGVRIAGAPRVGQPAGGRDGKDRRMTQPMDPMERQPGVGREGDAKNPHAYAQDGNAENLDGMHAQAQEAADRAREAAGNVATTARDTAENMTERAREAADNMGDRARDMEERGREEASSKLESVADQLRERAAGDGTKGEMA